MHKDNTILLKFKEEINEKEIELFLKDFKSASLLTSEKKERIMVILGSTEKGFMTYNPITYLIVVENGKRKVTEYNCPPPIGFSIWD